MSTPAIADEVAQCEQNFLLVEQRKDRRLSYVCRQLVAPFDGVRMPRQDEFQWAMFKDVSEAGISFLAETRPTTGQLVVAVGAAPFSFLIVEIVRVSELDDLEAFSFHIGCRVLSELNA